MSERCGYVAIVGRPNVGKSTLLNRILGQKISITSKRPQTTRHRILGIKTTENAQAIYVDTPGVHGDSKRAMNRFMNKTAYQSVKDVDVILFLVDGTKWTDDDELVLRNVKNYDTPVILVINKLDKLSDKEVLLPFIETMQGRHTFKAVVPVSAMKGKQVPELEELVESLLPESEFFFPEDQVTDRSERFLAAEIIREKLMRMLGQELPYYLTVEIDQFKQKSNGQISLAATIWVERDGQKAIIIGKNGEGLKEIGTVARKDMEKLFGEKVFLQLWVKVKTGWSDDVRALRSLGYVDNE